MFSFHPSQLSLLFLAALAARPVLCKLSEVGVSIRPTYSHPFEGRIPSTLTERASKKNDDVPKPDVMNTTLHSCGNDDGPRNVLCFPLSDAPNDGFISMSLDDDISPMGLCDPGRYYDILTQMNEKCTQGTSEYCTASMQYKCDFVGGETKTQGKDGVQTCIMTMTSDLNPSGDVAWINKAIKGIAQSLLLDGHESPKTVHIKKWDYGSQGGNGGSSLNVAIDCYKPPPSGFDICAFVTGLIGVFVPFIGPAFEKAGTVLSDTTKAIVSSAASGSSQFCMIK
ncbi:hypothetical protein FA10DRAFT_289544 [Acaromyces ingoldii]|uniref:Uncharacterized protein n=1 Tax=Acaromyces ingoldii TaxID=215250 RepID=A0A316YDG7_9BASI|nr:hypothetical protein FA10DRAFT_289544 [Acaromyces ingoldii]PWN86708.1 hypothetical protein FA10DRAFT_289544 [Acaromyces ingoldii]